MFDTVKELNDKYTELEKELCIPGVIANKEKYRELLRSMSELEEIVSIYREYLKVKREQEETLELIEMEEDEEAVNLAQEELEELKMKENELEEQLNDLLSYKDPNDDKNIIMEIRAGTGGEEACLFAADLFRMYSRFAENRKWKVEIINTNRTGLGGLKEIVFEIKGKKVYSILKYESGVHRVQRVPSTEASGRIHTSTATVAVLPEAEDVDDVKINPVDLKIDTYRSSGAGGQHVNKTDSAVRITHLPTGLVVACQDQRSQHQNRDKAMRVLKAHLLDIMIKEQQSDIDEKRRGQVGSGERCEKIRTYNFPQGRITDHRINLTLHNLEAILDGDLEDFVEAFNKYDKEQRLKAIA
ncbi:MAG TPA: peptide chain release factor 1 [Candidatus Eremiobacteraeota bacterium]|nr:MAG: Peptide chain release factor 1 [bacterium ADurb.Bin363]HPZ06599.1 peptide chain release factor 1 [Candidatus Eremiobacteraeota bacterium]